MYGGTIREQVCPWDNWTVRNNRFAFAFFAAAILFSMLREWNAPFACARPTPVVAITGHSR
jgi:hypothetical protein